jgi:hypothetical protein
MLKLNYNLVISDGYFIEGSMVKNPNQLNKVSKGKGKAIPLQAWTDP